MKLHVENLNIHVGHPNVIPVGLIASIALASVAKVELKAPEIMPAIGDKWPGTEAVYAGKAMSLTGDKIVHLIVWPNTPDGQMNYEEGVMWAERVNPEMASHVPTRMQSITLFENLQDQFSRDGWYWTLDKTKSGKAAFIQDFGLGDQYDTGLSSSFRVRAVSEIPL